MKRVTLNRVNVNTLELQEATFVSISLHSLLEAVVDHIAASDKQHDRSHWTSWWVYAASEIEEGE